MAKRKRRDGSLHLRKDGRWEGRYVVGYDEKGLGIVEKARTYFMINLQTMTDPSASHIASMLITGSSMGIVEAIQKYRQYEDADPKIRDLMDKLRKFEEHNMEKLKDFL